MDVSHQALVEPLVFEHDPVPFTGEEDPFIAEPRRARLVQALKRALSTPDALVLLRGEPGVGKSSVAHQFLATLEPEWRVSLISAQSPIDGVDLLARICRTLELEVVADDYRARVEKLLARLIRLRAADRPFLLVVDDCHRLQESALRTLLYLHSQASGQQRLMRLLLVGEPKRAEQAPSAYPKQMLEMATECLEVPRLDERGTASYLKHRLAAAGLTQQRRLTRSELREIHRLARGIPADIDLAAAPLLDCGEATPMGGSRRHWLLSYGVLLLGAAALLAAAMPAPHLPAAQKPLPDGWRTVSHWTSGTSVAELDADQGPASRYPPTATGAAARDPAPAAPADEVGETPPSPLRRDDWLLAQDPKAYTVMLLGARKEETIVGYIQSQQLGDKAYYFGTRWQDEPWFGLLYGLYPDRRTADAAALSLAHLPELGSPWVRTVAGVQTDILKLR